MRWPRRAPAPMRSASSCGRARRATSAIEQARTLAAVVPPFVSIVGLFVDPEPEHVRAALAEGAARHPAVSRRGTAGFLPQLRSPLPEGGAGRREMPTEVDLLEYAARYSDASGLLFDAPPVRRSAGRHGTDVRLGCAAAKPAAAADPLGRSQRRERRRRDSPVEAVGRGRVERRRGDRRRRQDDQRHEGSGADRRFHRGSAQCR